MRVGITLQSFDLTWGGIGTYTEAIVKHLLMLDRESEYVLMYPGFGMPRKMFGQYRKYKNAIEVETEFSRIPSGWYWDQMVVPKVAKHYDIDLLFNPFLSVPIRGHFKKVMIMHNVEYHIIPKVYDWKMYTRWFLLEKMILPAADRVISISHVMTQDFQHAIKYPIENVRTIYHGVSERFRVLHDTDKLREIKEEYLLPDDFILFVGHLYPQKNFANLARAFALIAKQIPHDLVVAGRPRWKHEGDLQVIESLGLQNRIHFLHIVPNHDIPAIYNQAACFVYPSLYESFGLAQLEAMACGCPVLGANAGAIPEIAGNAALLFDPHTPEDIAEKLLRVLQDAQLRETLIQKGLARVKAFTWDRCASETLQLFQEVMAD
jgi:glycosyltransferase involved in cell wall biosynthesis